MVRLLVLMVLAAGLLAAQTGSPAIQSITDPSDLTAAYQAAVGTWLSRTQTLGVQLFGLLALIEMTWFGINKLVFQGHMDLDSAIRQALLGKLFVLCFFLALMINAGTWIPLIINTFVDVGRQASGVPNLGPSIIMQTGVNITGELIWSAYKSAATLDPFTALGFLLGAAFIFVSFLVITGQFIVAQVDIYIAVGYGAFMLFLGASSLGAPYVERFIARCVSAGVQLASLYLLVGIGLSLAPTWKTQAAAAGGSFGGLLTGLIIGGSAFLFSFVTWHCSRTFSSWMAGTSTIAFSDAASTGGSMVSAGAAAGTLIATAAAAAPVTAASEIAAAGPGAALAAGPPPSAGAGASAGVSPPSGGSSAPKAAGAVAMTAMAANAIRTMPNGGPQTPPPTTPIPR